MQSKRILDRCETLTLGVVDIINVVSVTSQAQVKQWYEENDEEIQNALYWRQAFDVRTYELSVWRQPWCPFFFSRRAAQLTSLSSRASS